MVGEGSVKVFFLPNGEQSGKKESSKLQEGGDQFSKSLRKSGGPGLRRRSQP